MDVTQLAGLGIRTWGEVHRGRATVLALHGLTSTSVVWNDLAGRLDDLAVFAPDLPGRGLSVSAAAAPGLPGLADAVVAVVEASSLERVLVVGHSMGAFLAPLVVDRLGDRVVGTVLLDGGVPPDPSILFNPLAVRTLFTVQMRRLTRDWTDIELYTRTAEGGAAANRPDLHPQFRAWSEAVLHSDGLTMRPRLDRRRIVADAVDTLARPPHLSRLAHSHGPVHLIAAARGANDTRPAFLSEKAIAAGRLVVPRLTSERVDANHATMLFDPAAAAAVAQQLGR